MDTPSPPGTRLGGRTCKAHAMCLQNRISTPRHFSPGVQRQPTLFSRRAPRSFKPASRRHGSSSLRLTAPIRLPKSIRDVEAPRAHMSVCRNLGRRATAAHAAIPGVRCSSSAVAVAEHREFSVGILRRNWWGRRTDETASLVSSDCEGAGCWKEDRVEICRDCRGEKIESWKVGGPTRGVFWGSFGEVCGALCVVLFRYQR